MQNLTRHVCKKKPSIGEKLKSDVFLPFFEGSKIENFVFSIDNVLPNLLNTPYVVYELQRFTVDCLKAVFLLPSALVIKNTFTRFEDFKT